MTITIVGLTMKKIHSSFMLFVALCSMQSMAEQPHVQSSNKQITQQSLTHQLAMALAKEDKKQLSALQVAFLKQNALSIEQFHRQTQITENILTRIFKTDKNLTPKFLDYLYFEPTESNDATLNNAMKQNLLVSFFANEKAKIYIKHSSNTQAFIDLLLENGAKSSQLVQVEGSAKAILQNIAQQMQQDFSPKTVFSITENRISLIVPSSQIKPRLALANAIFDKQFKGVEVDDFSYLDQPRSNLQHNNQAIRYKTFQAMLEGLEN